MNYNKYRSISNYRIIPRLVCVGVEQTLTVYPIGAQKRFDDATEYVVSFVPMDIYDEDRFGEETDWEFVCVHPVDGIIRVSHVFDDEQEWMISITTQEERENKVRPVELRIYALKEDLYARNPYKGDLHSHSCCSDGKEDPAIVAANYRKTGFDFFALTDHHKWGPSEEIIRTYADVPLGMGIFHGEEVHVPTWIHVVNFGSRYSVNELYESNPEPFNALIEEQAKTLKTPKGVNALEYAWRKWTYEEIAKSGGLCIVAHPYWVIHQTHHMSTPMLEYVFDTGIYDAFELVGGLKPRENNLQTAFYQEQRAKGKKIPIVGSSDSHGTDPANYFGYGKTVVFAESLELSSICDAIRDGYSVAVEQHRGEEERVYGPYRLVRYAHFLLDQYFPSHDELCVEEGILMREYAMGDESVKERLASLAPRADAHMRKILRAEE